MGSHIYLSKNKITSFKVIVITIIGPHNQKTQWRVGEVEFTSFVVGSEFQLLPSVSSLCFLPC